MSLKRVGDILKTDWKAKKFHVYFILIDRICKWKGKFLDLQDDCHFRNCNESVLVQIVQFENPLYSRPRIFPVSHGEPRDKFSEIQEATSVRIVQPKYAFGKLEEQQKLFRIIVYTQTCKLYLIRIAIRILFSVDLLELINCDMARGMLRINMIIPLNNFLH